MQFADFILAHEWEDPVKLLLARGRYPDVDMDLVVSTLEARRVLRTKLPQWYAVPSLRYPSRLCAEQCSSATTASYKAKLLPSGLRLADLTGGLGVDAWAFSKVAKEVLYNEMNPVLAEAVRHNFGELGVKNVRFRSVEVKPGNVGEVLDGFAADVLFLDPARRASDGRKVFLLEDCSPDVTVLLPELFSHCAHVMLKLSPMADVTALLRTLPSVREVHIVAAEGECKEVLLLLERGWSGLRRMVVAEEGAVMEIPEEGEALLLAGRGDIQGVLFEPGRALGKAGAFDLPCRYGHKALGRNTHLYVAEAPSKALKSFGKYFEIQEVLHLDKRSLKALGGRFPAAEVTAKNIPLRSDELRARIGCRSGGDVHIFGAALDEGGENVLIVGRRIA